MKNLVVFLLSIIVLVSCTKENVDYRQKYVGTYIGSGDLEALVDGKSVAKTTEAGTIKVSLGSESDVLALNDDGTIYEVVVTDTGVLAGTYTTTLNLSGTALTLKFAVTGTITDKTLVMTQNGTSSDGRVKLVMKLNLNK